MTNQLRNRQDKSRAPKENGYRSNEDIKSKLMLIEEIDQIQSGLEEDKNNNRLKDAEDLNSFSDTQTVAGSSHAKLNGDEQIAIFGGQTRGCTIGESVKDQFASSLLRLQVDLERTSEKLNELEAKIDAIQKRQQRQQRGASQGNGKTAGLLGSKRLATVMYLGWPLLVFVALRALERRYPVAKSSM